MDLFKQSHQEKRKYLHFHNLLLELTNAYYAQPVRYNNYNMTKCVAGLAGIIISSK